MLFFLDENTTGDGLLSALHLLQVLVDTKKPLSELATIMEVLPQALVNAKVPNDKKNSYMENPQIADAIDALDKEVRGRRTRIDQTERNRATCPCHDRRQGSEPDSGRGRETCSAD